MRYLTKKHLSRRTVLRGAGVALGLPFLESMLPAGVRSAAAAGVPRTRLACIYIPHGCVMEQWRPTATGRGFELTPTLQSLEPFRDRLNIVSGLKLPAAYVGESSAAANHGRSSQCWLTCMPEDSGPSPTSADQLAAQHVGQETPLPSLELALEAGSSISYLTPQTPLPMETNPRVVFERLLGDGSTPAERAARQRQLSSLLDSVTGQVAALQRDLPGPDRERMDRYLDRRPRARATPLAGRGFPAHRARGARQAERHPRRLRRARDADVRPAGARVGRRSHAHRDLHGVARAEQPSVSAQRRERRISQRLAPLGHSGEHRAAREAQRISHARRRSRISCASWPTHPTATAACSITRLSFTAAAWRIRISTITTRCRCCSRAAVPAGCEGGRHIHAADGTPFANLLVTVLDKLDVPVASFGDSTGALDDLTAAEMACARCGVPCDRPSARCWRWRPARLPLKRRRSHRRPPTCRLRRSRQRRSAATPRPSSRLLDDGADPNAPGRDGTPALHWVVRVGDRATAERLVRAGADVERRQPLRRHAARTLAIAAGDAAMTRWLLDVGADATRADRAGEPPLLQAARVGDSDVAAALLEHGVAVDARESSFGQTALMIAASARARRARAAIARRGRGYRRSDDGRGRRRASFRRASRRRASPKASASCAPAGPKDAASAFPPAARRRRCCTPRATASSTSHALLVERGANLELADGNGITPLLSAILNASLFRVSALWLERSSWRLRICCSTPARTSTRWIGTARRRSGPPSICAISSSAPPTRRPASATKRSR